jgi:UDP-N-acetyl-D-glucosamine/UDP-N-acetyl-D-galactosamine dehydrogenase
MNLSKLKLAIVGLGYVGLPLAIEFGKTFNNVFGFDINKKRIKELNLFSDTTGEISPLNIRRATNLKFSHNLSEIKYCNCYIIAVPTPVSKINIPDLRLLINASKLVAKVLKKNDVVIYESTVYPGATEEICVPILEKFSLLKFNKDFYVGYSPERINPGDKKHTIKNIIKVVAGSTIKTRDFVSDLYSCIVKAGTYKVSSIRTAEAAKIIENTQRDLNIALVNELSIVFHKLKLDTEEILKAAETKWNFNSYRPGLVGGHCIGVDPYYLTYKSKKVGYNPKIILAGRNLNNNMPKFLSIKLKNFLKVRKKLSKHLKILIMGLSFKENCSDIRNSKVFNLISILSKQFKMIDCYDPWVRNIKKTTKFKKVNFLKKNYYDVVILCVKHNEFINLGIKKIRTLCKKDGIIYDLKYFFPKNLTDLRL